MSKVTRSTERSYMTSYNNDVLHTNIGYSMHGFRDTGLNR